MVLKSLVIIEIAKFPFGNLTHSLALERFIINFKIYFQCKQFLSEFLLSIVLTFKYPKKGGELLKIKNFVN